MAFTKVMSKLSRRQNFAVVRKNLDRTTAAFAECRRKFGGLIMENNGNNGIENNVYKIKNHILLIFKLHVYKSREKGTLELSRLINEIKKVELLEINSAQNHVRKLEQYNIKWEKTRRAINI